MNPAATPAAQVQLDRDNPWPGLESYGELTQHYFSGRAQEREELLRRVLDSSVTVLFGKSGLGKTSLLKAGVFPGLRDKGYLPVHLRLHLHRDAPAVCEQIQQAFAQELMTHGIDHPAWGANEGLWEYLHRADLELWTPQNHLTRPVFVFDQFEELFTLGRSLPAVVARFRNDLADLAENRIPTDIAQRLEAETTANALDLRAMPYKIVITLREDFLAELECWRGAMPSLRHNRMRLLPMNAAQAFEAVHNSRTEHVVSEVLARRVVAFLSSAGAPVQDEATAEADSMASVEPALLSLFCRGLNEQRKRAGKEQFDAALVEGAQNTIVADFYRDSLRDQSRQARRFVEEQLVTEHGFRNSYSIDDALTHGSLTATELDTLVNRRLLRREHHLGAERVELTHDLLTRAVVEQRAGRRHLEQRRRQGLLMGALGLGCIVLLAIAVWAYEQADAADRLRLQAQSRELAARAERVRNDDPYLAIRLALAAAEVEHTPQANAALLDATRHAWPSELLHQQELGGEPAQILLSPAGQRLFVLTTAGLVTTWDLSRGEPVKVPLVGRSEFPGAARMALSTDGATLAVASSRGIELEHLTSGQVDVIEQIGDVSFLAFSPDSSWLGAIINQERSNQLVLWQRAQRGWGTIATRREVPANGPIHVSFQGNTSSGAPRLLVITDEGCDQAPVYLEGGLAACSVEVAADGKVRSRQLDLFKCVKTHSVSPGGNRLSATFRARECVFNIDSFNVEAAREGEDEQDSVDDIVWSANGAAYARKLQGNAFDVGSNELILPPSRVAGVSSTYAQDLTGDIAVSSDASRLVVLLPLGVKIYSLGSAKGFVYPLDDSVRVAADGRWFAAIRRPLRDGSTLIEVTQVDAPSKGGRAVVSTIEMPAGVEELWPISGLLLARLDSGEYLSYDARTGRPLALPLRTATSEGEDWWQVVDEVLVHHTNPKPGKRRIEMHRVEGVHLIRIGVLEGVLEGATVVGISADGTHVLFSQRRSSGRSWELQSLSHDLPTSADVDSPLWSSQDVSRGQVDRVELLAGGALLVARGLSDESSLWIERAGQRGSLADSARQIAAAGSYDKISRTGRYLLSKPQTAANGEQQQFVTDLKSEHTVLKLEPGRSSFSPDERWLAHVHDSILEVYDLSKAGAADEHRPVLHLEQVSEAVFHGGGRMIGVELVGANSATMLIPLEEDLIIGFARRLAAARVLSKEERCQYLPGGGDCN